MSFQLAELHRQLYNLVKIGTVHSVNYQANTARVEFGEVVTDFLPWTTTRSAGNRTYDSLEVGEQVVVLTPPGGASGIIIATLNQTAYPAPDHSADIQKTIYKDGSSVTYDRAAHVLTVDVKGDAKIVTTGNIQAKAGKDVSVKADKAVDITAGTSATFSAKNMTLNAEQLTVNAPMSQGGGSNGGDATFNGSLHTTGDITTDSDVVADVSLNGHGHECKDGGTGAPK